MSFPLKLIVLFQNRDRAPSGGSSDEMSPPANRVASGMNAMASMAFQR